MKNIIHLVVISLILFNSCEINQKDIHPTDNFVKIYNNPDEDLTYYAESIIQLQDGYLILSGLDNNNNLTEYPVSSLIRTNSLGEVQWSVENEWMAPAGELVNFNNKIGYVAMNRVNDGYFIEVNTQTGDVTATDLNITTPLASYVNSNGNLVVLGYDFTSSSSEISLFSPAFNLINSEKLAFGGEVRTELIGHLKKSGTIFPFFIGNWQKENLEGFYVNCLSNYFLKVVFFGSDGSRTGGEIFSHLTSNALSSLVQKEDDSYSLTRFYNNNNYISPTINVDEQSLQNFNDSTQNPLHELVPNAKVSTILAEFDNTNYTLFAGTTNSNSVIIYKYNAMEDELLQKLEIDFAHKIEVAQIIQDPTDQGIVILAQHYITGKYLRPVLIKVPKRDF